MKASADGISSYLAKHGKELGPPAPRKGKTIMAPHLYDRPEVCSTYFFPQEAPPLPHDPHASPVALRLPDGTRIEGFRCRPLAGAPTILYLHGNGECIADQLGHWPAWAREAGANLFLLDWPGYGGSPGNPTFTSCREAAAAALDHLLALPPAEVPSVVVAGRSVGSIFALDAAHRACDPRVRGLVLESAVADVMARLEPRVDWERVGIDRGAIRREIARDFDARKKLGAIRFPVLVLHTRSDSLVPSWNAERLAEWAGERLWRLVLFDRGDHNTIQIANEITYRRHLADFVSAAFDPRTIV